MLQSQHVLTSNFPLSLSQSPPHNDHFLYPCLSSNLSSLRAPTALFSVPSQPRGRRPFPWLAQVSEPNSTTSTTETTEQEEGPIELFQSTSPIFATNDEPSSIQVATSVLLTGAISVFLFRSLRRRAKRVKELKFRSSEVKKSLKDEALDSLKAMGSSSLEAKSQPSPVQALLGGISAGVIALILYKFTTTIEAALNRQTISDNFSVRQITITIRTIVNGLCYLATFVFGINSVGLFLYAGQLAINSSGKESTEKETENLKGEDKLDTVDSDSEGSKVNTDISSNEDQNSDKNY